ncbi:ABC transporter permease [Desulfosarcina ovata subsp. ovata]|uniref:ABC transporter permease n=2 Tax=Desulfosarcina ovata TaxID=83564 RepID=A0A5K8ABS0_9BACT|nr:ABC transporter permease [Desulfosarcina ovata subsp. ovata]
MFPENWRFHVWPFIDAFIDYLNTTVSPLLDVFNGLVLKMLLTIDTVLLFLPWWLIIALIVVLCYGKTKSLSTALTLAFLLLTVGLFGLWETTLKTLSVVIVAVIISLALGIPFGIVMAESKPASKVMNPVLDAMQTMPPFVYLLPAIMLFGLGKVPAVFATVIYATPPAVRLTSLGINQVDVQVIEAANAFGVTRWQMLREVKLPLAVPSILTGMNQTTMMALSMVVIASMIGAGGLGKEVLMATNKIAGGEGFEAGWAIVVVAIVIDRLTQGFIKQKKG